MSESVIDRAQILAALRDAAKRLPVFILEKPPAFDRRRNRRDSDFGRFASQRSATGNSPESRAAAAT
jgi:hypothetical protein